MVSFTVFVPSIVLRHFGSCMLLYKISALLCLHTFSVVVHTSFPAAHIRFEDADGESFADYPSKILSCISRQRDGVDTFDLIIQCCGKATLREPFLFKEWTFKPDFFVVETSAVVTSCLVIPSTSNGSKGLVSRDRTDWASQFCDAANVNMTRI
jgi:hypothetical protein